MSRSQQTIPVITIDGPTGSGKGTVSRLVAERLGWHLLDSGAIYRVFALASLEKHIAVDDEHGLAKLAGKLDIEFVPGPTGDSLVLLAGHDVTEAIRQEKVGSQASKVSQYREVRQALLECQRSFQRFPGLVADGRDMGTIIFPDAELKIFLSATAEERAKRRYHQLTSKGITADYNEILSDLLERDHRDQTRPVAPLKPAKDAELIDNTDISIEQAVQKVINLAHQHHLVG
ncbi:MAG: (d)CMP kinase [Gammaproteobacteria bacterium]